MIRQANANDALAIRKLLLQMGYPANINDLGRSLNAVKGHNDHQVLVYEMNKEAAGFIALHFVPPLASYNTLAIINYLAVEERYLGQGIGKALEQAAEKLAWERGCDHIQLHCRLEREKAHGFYKSRGYKEYPVYYSKILIYAE